MMPRSTPHLRNSAVFAPTLRVFAIALFYGVFVLEPAQAQATAEPCLLTRADIEAVFGKGFSEGKPSKIGDFSVCRLEHKDYSIHVSIHDLKGSTFEQYNKMMSPKTVTWKLIPNDPDGAAIEVRDDKKDDNADIPAIAYARKNKYVRLQVMGNYCGFDRAKMPKARDEMREKLAKLRRIP